MRVAPPGTWSRPTVDFVKVNIDASFRGAVAGLGMVDRDSNAEVLASTTSFPHQVPLRGLQKLSA